MFTTVKPIGMDYTPQQLVADLGAKRPEAFQYLVDAFGGMIRGYVRKNSGDDEDAKELIQQVLLEFWVAIQENRYREEGKMGHYLYQLTANCWRDELRRRKRQPVESMSEQFQVVDESPEAIRLALVKDRQLEAIHAGIAQLGSPCQEIIQLYHLQRVKLQEVAVQLAYDYDNLRKRIFDCRKKLKTLSEKILQDWTKQENEANFKS